MKYLAKWWTIILSIAGVLVLGGFLWLCSALYQNEARAQAYAQVQRGDSEGRVQTLLGHPYQVSGAPQYLAWDTDASIRTNTGECVREFWYAPRFSLAGGAWVVGFDGHSNVVSKYHYVSP